MHKRGSKFLLLHSFVFPLSFQPPLSYSEWDIILNYIATFCFSSKAKLSSQTMRAEPDLYPSRQLSERAYSVSELVGTPHVSESVHLLASLHFFSNILIQLHPNFKLSEAFGAAFFFNLETLTRNLPYFFHLLLIFCSRLNTEKK